MISVALPMLIPALCIARVSSGELESVYLSNDWGSNGVWEMKSSGEVSLSPTGWIS